MNSEQEKKLLDYLASLGFEGEKFTAGLQEKLRLDTPNFTVTHKRPFGDELMLFKLYFARDLQFDAYRLQKYHATHRSPVITEHMIINGVDTDTLEARMKVQDWDLYFDPHKEATHPNEIKEMREINSLLNKLAEGQNLEGIEIQEELLYKYWPEDNYVGNNKSDFKFYHEHDRDFSVTEYGTCNTNLAYHVLSGRLDDLFEKLRSMDLEQWPGADLYPKLEQILSKNPEDFKLQFSRNEPEGYTEITIPVITVANEFSLDTYTASLKPYPAIEHGTYNGIDTKKLEEQMQELDWHNDQQLFVFHTDSEPEFKPKVGDIQEQMYRLSLDMAGADIADQLQLKYWSDATFFSDMLQQAAWDYLDKLPNRTQKFPAELNAKAGYNLLCGRAVPEKLMFPFRPESDNWIKLNLDRRDGYGNYEVVPVKGFGKTELENVLNVLPIPDSWYYPVKNGLLRGDLVTVPLVNDKKVLMEANPEQRSVNVYTADMRPISTNIHLDPDWKPPIQEPKDTNLQSDKKIQPSSKYLRPKPVKKHKGKGL